MSSFRFQLRVGIACVFLIFNTGNAIVACVQQPWMAAGLFPFFAIFFTLCKSTRITVELDATPSFSRPLSYKEFGLFVLEVYPKLPHIMCRYTDPVRKRIAAGLWLKLAIHTHAFACYLFVMSVLALCLLFWPGVLNNVPASSVAELQSPLAIITIGASLGWYAGAACGWFYRWMRVQLARQF
jgi:hypothetical protein